jgi:hypothetical protein
MLYYKVKSESDQVQASITCHSFLIKDELFTLKEISKAKNKGWIRDEFVKSHFRVVEVNPKNTYFFFGARFESK